MDYNPVSTVLNTPELLEQIILATATSLLEPQGAINFHYGRESACALLKLQRVSRTWRTLILASPQCKRLLFLDFPRRPSQSLLSSNKGRYHPFVYTTFQAEPTGLRRNHRALAPVPFVGMKWILTPGAQDTLFFLVERAVFRKWTTSGSWKDMFPARQPHRTCFVGRYDCARAVDDMWVTYDVVDADCYASNQNGLTCGEIHRTVMGVLQKRPDQDLFLVVCGNDMPPPPSDDTKFLLSAITTWLNQEMAVLRGRI